MMKTIQHTSTLFYYDGPQIIEAQDPIGGHYIGVMVESEDDSERYLVVGASPERLRQFRVGALDLRSLFVERDAPEWYLANALDGDEQHLTLFPQSGPISESEYLPEAGFVLRHRDVKRTRDFDP